MVDWRRTATDRPSWARLSWGRVLVAIALVAGCSSTTPTRAPSSGATATPATAAPSPTVTAAPTVRVTAEPIDAQAALDAFYELIADTENLSFHLFQRVDMTVDGDRRPAILGLYDLDVSGHSGSGKLVAGAGGQTVDAELIFIGDDIWLRLADGDWSIAPPGAFDTAEIWNIWRFLPAKADLEIADIGRTLVRFDSSQPVPYQTASMRASGATGSITYTGLHLLPDGRPHRIVWVIEAEGVVAGTPTMLRGNSDTMFTNWGDPITIEPPLD